LGPKDIEAQCMTEPTPSPCLSHQIVLPFEQTAPVVFASPHSGQNYSADLLSLSALDPLTLRRSEDAFVDELFAAAPGAGAPLIKALFPRVFLDANREPFELDPTMFAEPLPAHVNANSPRVAAGLGTIARVVASGEDIYRRKLRLAEATERIATHYTPYHNSLTALLDKTMARFGGVLLIDCHSMPSIGGPMDSDPGLKRVDIVLGDCHGTSCAPAITDYARNALVALGYVVRRNNPYAGGYTTRHYGRPNHAHHALQIEINRALYMDEDRIRHNARFPVVQQHIGELISALTRIAPAMLTRC